MTRNETTLEPVPDSAMEAEPLPSVTSGVRALVGVAVAIVGVLAAVNPQSVWLRAINHAMPQLADTLPTLITACGAVLAAFSQPPTIRRVRARRTDRASEPGRAKKATKRERR